VDPLEAYMDRGGTPDNPAELYYNLGRLHENRRDAGTAMSYYRRVVDGYPLSRYWEPAEGRIQYLRRHFFDIR
jgi:outer membrane protein assembly factor BamD (BamD/ComL family)